MCKTGKVAHMEVDSDVFFGTLTVHSLSDTADKNNPWEVTIQLNGEPVLFKINTGADVSVIPETVFKQLPGVSLNPNRHLVGLGQNQLKVSGQFTGKLTYQNSVADEQIYVVKQLQKSLLGRPGILALNLHVFMLCMRWISLLSGLQNAIPRTRDTTWRILYQFTRGT